MEKTEAFVSGTWIEFITSWFTPKILFCAMNIMIGTIFVSSNLKSRTTKHQDINNDHEHHRNYNQFPFHLMRPPSLLERVRSFDFSLFPAPSHDPNHQEPEPSPSPSLLQRVKSIKLSRIYSSSSPEQSPTVVVPSEKKKKMKKSESMKEIAAPLKVTDYDEVNQIRPATTRESNKNDCLGLLDDEIDAKADDFIQRFRKELKLERLESLLKYKEMLKSGSSRN